MSLSPIASIIMLFLGGWVSVWIIALDWEFITSFFNGTGTQDPDIGLIDLSVLIFFILLNVYLMIRSLVHLYLRRYATVALNGLFLIILPLVQVIYFAISMKFFE